MPILDPTADVSGMALYRATILHDAPAYVKAASEADLRGDKALPAHAFADPVGRRFPMDTPAATWFSAATLHEDGATISPDDFGRISESLSKAAAFWGIEGDIHAVVAKSAAAATDNLADLPDDGYALVEIVDGGTNGRFYPLRNADEVKAAAAWLTRYRDDFEPGDRQKIARKIMTRADALAVDLGDVADTLERAAGLGLCTRKAASTLVKDRAFRLRRDYPEMSAELTEMSNDIINGDISVRDHLSVCKLAGVLDGVDRALNLTRLYASGEVERPDDVLFAVTSKSAGTYAGSRVVDIEGRVYVPGDFEKISARTLRDVGGPALVDQFSDDGMTIDLRKMAGVVPLLDEADATLFHRAAAESGVAVVEREPGVCTTLDRGALAAALRS